MCFLSSTTQINDEKVAKLLEAYTSFSGIHCEAFYNIEDSHIVCTEYQDDACRQACYCDLSNQFSIKSFQEILKFNNINGKAFIFSCQNPIYLWAVAPETFNGVADGLVFIGGPVILSHDNIAEGEDSVLYSCVSTNSNQIVKKVHIGDIEHYSSLLFEMVHIYYNDKNFKPVIAAKQQESNSFNMLGEVDYQIDNQTWDIFSVKQNSMLVNRLIKGIVDSARNHNSTEVNTYVSKLLTPIKKHSNSDILFSQACVLGVASLLSQEVLGSADFHFSKRMFWIFSQFTKRITLTTETDELIDISYRFFSEFYNHLSLSCINSEENKYSSLTMEYIKVNYMRDFGIEDIALSLHINEKYLCRVFKIETGLTIKQFITFFRMQQAEEMLSSTEYSIKRIAANVGYREIRSFNAAFRKFYQMSPNEYRLLCTSNK